MATVNIVAKTTDPVQVQSTDARLVNIIADAVSSVLVQKPDRPIVVVKAAGVPGLVHISKPISNSISITRISGDSVVELPPFYGYALQDGPEYTETLAYVGFANEGGAWFVYRRNRLTNERLYAYGITNYAAAWAAKEGLSYDS